LLIIYHPGVEGINGLRPYIIPRQTVLTLPARNLGFNIFGVVSVLMGGTRHKS